MTDSISRISDISSSTHSGTGSAREKKRFKNSHRSEAHDTVSISEEARRRSSTEEDQWEVSDER